VIPVYEPLLGEKELEYVTDCVCSGWVSSLGSYVVRFEESFARFCGVRYGTAVANGTVALHLALRTLDIGPGDEVIVPTLTFVATASAVAHAGARPVFVDAEPDTWNLDPAQVEAAITPRTRAIIPVHLYGHPVDMEPILALAEKHKLWVIEDAAESHGAEYKGRRVGGLGHLGCFSFYGNKIITTGEGGMVVTDDQELAQRATFLKDHAMSSVKRYWHPEIGFNYRLTNLQAALGVAQMERIDEVIRIKRQHAAYYNALLANVPGLTLPPEAPWALSVYWMYSVLVEEAYGVGRDELMARLQERGIDSRPFFYPIHTMPPYAAGERFPVAEELSRKGINLPSAATLTEDQIAFIAETLRELSKTRE
jgi:perosamine synthetase